jgi:NitT/TauT family transport system substrate-binding protein
MSMMRTRRRLLTTLALAGTATLNDYPYKWRAYDAEDNVRFYTLRLQEVSLIKSTPQKILAEGTDWRFLNEVKRELKA